MDKQCSQFSPRNIGRNNPEKFISVGWPAIVFALYLSAGQFKGDPRLNWIPADITLLFAVLTFLLLFATFALWKPTINGAILWVLALYFAFVMSGLNTEWTPYASEKFNRFITLTLLSSVTPFVLFKNWDEIRKLFNAIIIIGVLITIDALSIFVQNMGHWTAESRLTATASNTIELGRYAGMVGIYVILRAAQRSAFIFFLSVVALIVIIGVMLGSGSRGPILGVIIALSTAFFIFHRGDAKVVVRILFLVAAVVVFLSMATAVLPARSVQRIEMFFSSDGFAQSSDNSSVILRENALRVAIENINDHPMGIGVGGFERITRTHSREMVYPHNIILEILMENGWITGLFFIALMLITLHRSASTALTEKTVEAQVVFSLIIFFFINALVSGDLNDNRFLFALISITLAAYHGRNHIHN
jgi:O-antigen ligase